MAEPFDPLANSISARTQLLDQLSSGVRVSPKVAGAIDLDAATQQGEFVKGLRRFGYGMSATSQAFLGQMAEPFAPDFAKSQFNQALDTMQRMPQSVRPEFETFDQARDGGLRGVGSYALGALGEGLPSVALNLAGGGVGGVAARALGRNVLAGRLAGGAATMLPMEGGETALDIQQDPQALANTTPAERAALSLGRGSVNAVAESIVPQLMIAPRLMGQAARIGPGLGNAVRNTGLAAAEGALGEYGTEFAQDLTGQAAMKIARGDPLGSGYDLAQANEAGIKGAITGGAIGGIAGGVQGVYSNLAPAVESAGDAAKKTKSAASNFVNTLYDAVTNPEKFGADAANMTLDGLARAADGAGEGRKAFGRAMESGAEKFGDFKQKIDEFVLNNIDPEKQQAYIDATSKLSGMGVAEWQTLAKSLQEDSGGKFFDTLAAIARARGPDVAEGAAGAAKGLWQWAKDFGKGFSDTVSERGKGKQSAVLYTDRDRSLLQADISTTDAGVAKRLRGMSIKERREFLDTVLRLRDNPSYLTGMRSVENADGTRRNEPLRKAELDAWKAETGSDLIEFLGKLNSRRGKKALDPSLFAMGERMSDSAAEELEALKNQLDPEIDQDVTDDDAPGSRSAENALKGAEQAQANDGLQGEDKPYVSPFDLEHLQQSMSDDRFDQRKKWDDGSIKPESYAAKTGVEVELSADGLTPSQLAQIVGKRVNNQSVAFREGEVSDDKPLRMRINPQSLQAMAKTEVNRDRFQEVLSEYDDFRSDNQMAGDRVASLMAVLFSDGVEITDPAKYGIDSDGPIRIKVTPTNPRQFQPGLLMRREKILDPKTGQPVFDKKTGKMKFKDYTYAEWSGQVRAKTNPLAQRSYLNSLLRAGKKKKLDKSPEALDRAFDSIAQQVVVNGEVVKAADVIPQIGESGELLTALKIYNTVRAIAQSEFDSKKPSNATKDDGPTQSDLRRVFKEYVESGLQDRITKTRLSSRVVSDKESLRDMYSNGDMSRAELERIIGYYRSKGEQAPLKLMMELGLVTQRDGFDAAKYADSLEAMMEAVDKGQARSEAIITGRGDQETDSVLEEFEARMIDPVQKTNQSAMKGRVKGSSFGGPAEVAEKQLVGDVKTPALKPKKTPAEDAGSRQAKRLLRALDGVNKRLDKVFSKYFNTPEAVSAQLPPRAKALFDRLLADRTARVAEFDPRKPESSPVRSTTKSEVDIRKQFAEWLNTWIDKKKGGAPIIPEPQAMAKAAPKGPYAKGTVFTSSLGIQYESKGTYEQFGYTFVAVPNSNQGDKSRKYLVIETSTGQAAGYGSTISGTIAAAQARMTALGEKRLRETIEKELAKRASKSTPPPPPPPPPPPSNKLTPEEQARADDVIDRLKKAYALGNTDTALLKEAAATKGIPKEVVNVINKRMPTYEALKTGKYAVGGIAQKTVDSWSRRFAGGVPVTVYELPSDNPLFEGMPFPAQSLGGMALTIDGQHMILKVKGGWSDKVSSLSRLAHEFGHILQKIAFNNASEEVKQKLREAHEQDVEAFISGNPGEVGRFTNIGRLAKDDTAAQIGAATTVLPVKEMQRQLGLKALARMLHEYGTDVKTNQSVEFQKYLTSFDEWFAEQFSKYITSGNTKMDPEVRSFWAKLYKDLKSFFDNVVRQLVPNEEFKSWVDSLVPQQPAVDLEKTIADTIAGAKTPLKLQQIAKRIEARKDELGKEALDRLRAAWAAKRDELKKAEPPKTDPALEKTIADTIAAAKTTLRLQQIAKRIEARKGDLDKEALARLRAAWAAKRDEIKKSGGTPPPPPPPPNVPAVVPDPDDGKKKPSKSRALITLPASMQKELTDLQKEFVKRVEKLLGSKRVKVLFDQKLPPGVAAEFKPLVDRDEALKMVRDARRKALDKGDKELAAEYLEHEQTILNDTAILGILRVATGREEQGGLAEHESFHGAFAFFFNTQERSDLGTAFSRGLVNKYLRQIFANEPEVLKKIDPNSKYFDPEEAAAYGFQVWLHDSTALPLGERATTLFGKLKEFLRKLFGLTTPEERAKLILQDFASGRRAERKISPVARVLDKDRPWTERAQKYLQDMGSMAKGAYDIALGSVYERLVDKENPMLAKIARTGYQPTGADGSGGMVQNMIAETTRRYNQLTKIYEGLSDDELRQLHDANIFDKAPADAKLRERWERVNDWYKEMYTYQREAGVNLNNAGIDENYYPLNWDPEKVLKNKAQFLAMLKQPKYADVMGKLGETPDEIWDSITGYFERGEELVNIMGANNEPVSENSLSRTLGFISKEDRREFMADDPVAGGMQYAKQAVRHAEYVRAYGAGGSKLSEWKNEAKTRYGATEDDLLLVDDYINGLLGNKEIGMSRELKDLYGGLTVYQNIRLLPLSIFSSLVDPLGIGIRTNSIGSAWETFTYSLKNLFRDWKDQYTPDEWRVIAEDLGTIESAGTSANAEALYTGITLRGTTKKINDAFFKYNLLNGWIKSNHIMATKAAQLFLYRASQGMFKEHSARYLEEVGVEKSDIVWSDARQRILLRKDELVAAGKSEKEAAEIEARLHEALRTIVRQSLLRPNAAELTNWMSNPYLAPITHLKQFVWGFNATIVNRVQHELENDNFKPLMLAASYVPAMIAADFLKDMVGNFGEEPPYKKDWGVTDYVWNGVQRSGFTGTGQLFLDAKEDIMRGGGGYESLAGPTLAQFKKLGVAVSTGNTEAMNTWMVKALPANAIYDQALLN